MEKNKPHFSYSKFPRQIGRVLIKDVFGKRILYVSRNLQRNLYLDK